MLLVFRLSRRQPFPMTKSYYKINKFTNTHIQYKERESEREREKERWKIIIVIEKKMKWWFHLFLREEMRRKASRDWSMVNELFFKTRLQNKKNDYLKKRFNSRQHFIKKKSSMYEICT